MQDPEKRKYFKIEKANTAPSAAAWSSEAVKRRKIQDTAIEAQRQRAHLVRNHIKRHTIQQNAISGPLLSRELGLGFSAEHGRGRTEHAELGTEAWVKGVVEKGRIPFVPSFARMRFANMPCFYVGVEDTKTGLGIAYASKLDDSNYGRGN